MTRDEMVSLVQFVAAVCPQQKIGRETTIPWYEVIGHLEFEAAREAVIALKHSQAFVDPSDIIREARRAKGRPYDCTAAEALEMANQRALNAEEVSPGIGALWRDALAREQRENYLRIRRVLKHPDLAARLCQPPLPWSSPAQWNGFVPPRFLAADAGGNVRPNDSPERAALVEICTEAARRELEAAP